MENKFEIDWNIPDEIWDEHKGFGLSAQVCSAQNYWANKLALSMTNEQLLELFKSLSEAYWDERYWIHLCSSVHQIDEITWLDRKKFAVVQALGMLAVRHIEDPLADEYEARCKEAEANLDKGRNDP